MMTPHDVNIFHMDDVYGQHIHFHSLIIHMQLATNPHFYNI